MDDEYKIIKHGKKPYDEVMYFVCTFCWCEFSTKKKNCIPSFEELQRDETCISHHARCPECERYCVGMTYNRYKQFISIRNRGESDE